MKKSVWVMTGLAIAVAAGVIFTFTPAAEHMAAQKILESRTPRASATPHNFTLPDANGKRVSLSDFKGKVVVLNFWATWCEPCKTEIPWFVEFEKNYRDRGFTVLGVSMDEDEWKVVKPFVAENRINYPIVVANQEVNLLYGGIESLPTTLVIGRDGKIAFVHTGLIARSEYEKEIQQLLARS